MQARIVSASSGPVEFGVGVGRRRRGPPGRHHARKLMGQVNRAVTFPANGGPQSGRRIRVESRWRLRPEKRIELAKVTSKKKGFARNWRLGPTETEFDTEINCGVRSLDELLFLAARKFCETEPTSGVPFEVVRKTAWQRLHADRVIGGDRHHRHSGRAFVAGAFQSQGRGDPGGVHQQSKAVGFDLGAVFGRQSRSIGAERR